VKRHANDPDCPKCKGTGIEEEHEVGGMLIAKACDCFKLREVRQ
jgi:hypothetical protein